MAGKIIFKSEQVKRLKQQMQIISEDTNRLRQMVNSAANSWSTELPVLASLHNAQNQISKLTSDAEHLVEVIQKAIEGVEKVQNQSKQQSSVFGDILSGMEEFFRRYGANAAAALLFPAAMGPLVNRLINDVVKENRFNDEWKEVPRVKQLLDQLKNGTEQEKQEAEALLTEIYDARDNIARAQIAWDVYHDYGNEGLMNLAHKEAETSRQKLRDLGVEGSYFDEDQTDLRRFYKGSEINACSFDPSYTYTGDPQVPPIEMMDDNQYKYYLELGRKQDGKGDYARQLLSEIHEKFSEISRAQVAYGEYAERGMTNNADDVHNYANGLRDQLKAAPYFLFAKQDTTLESISKKAKYFAEKSLDSWKQIGTDIAKGFEERADKSMDSVPDFLNYLTMGIPKGINEGLKNKGEKALDSPYDFANWISLGLVETAKEAVVPEEPLSKEHWAASLGLASMLAGGIAGAVAKSGRVSSGISEIEHGKSSNLGKEKLVEGTEQAIKNALAKGSAKTWEEFLAANPGKKVLKKLQARTLS